MNKENFVGQDPDISPSVRRTALKWNAAVLKSKSAGQEKLSTHKTEALSQFIHHESSGVVTKRIKEWEVLYMQLSSTSEKSTITVSAARQIKASDKIKSKLYSSLTNSHDNFICGSTRIFDKNDISSPSLLLLQTNIEANNNRPIALSCGIYIIDSYQEPPNLIFTAVSIMDEENNPYIGITIESSSNENNNQETNPNLIENSIRILKLVCFCSNTAIFERIFNIIYDDTSSPSSNIRLQKVTSNNLPLELDTTNNNEISLSNPGSSNSTPTSTSISNVTSTSIKREIYSSPVSTPRMYFQTHKDSIDYNRCHNSRNHKVIYNYNVDFTNITTQVRNTLPNNNNNVNNNNNTTTTSDSNNEYNVSNEMCLSNKSTGSSRSSTSGKIEDLDAYLNDVVELQLVTDDYEESCKNSPNTNYNINSNNSSTKVNIHDVNVVHDNSNDNDKTYIDTDTDTDTDSDYIWREVGVSEDYNRTNAESGSQIADSDVDTDVDTDLNWRVVEEKPDGTYTTHNNTNTNNIKATESSVTEIFTGFQKSFQSIFNDSESQLQLQPNRTVRSTSLW
eukprot:gene6892-13984_t